MNNDEKNARKGIYLLPNLLTTSALFAGFYSIVAAINGHFEAASVSVFIAMVLDGLDGRVARLTNTQTEFGAEYDSLSDLVSFGLAPALLTYQWALVHMRDMGVIWGKLGWLAAFLYVACAALRLARFNTQIAEVDKRWFVGLPSPAAAAVVVGLVWVFHDLSVLGINMIFPAFILIVFSALLMVSNIRYYSFKDFDLSHKVPFLAIFMIVLVLMLTSIDPPKVLFAVAFIYALSGPIWRIIHIRKIRLKKRKESK